MSVSLECLSLYAARVWPRRGRAVGNFMASNDVTHARQHRQPSVVLGHRRMLGGMDYSETLHLHRSLGREKADGRGFLNYARSHSGRAGAPQSEVLPQTQASTGGSCKSKASHLRKSSRVKRCSVGSPPVRFRCRSIARFIGVDDVGRGRFIGELSRSPFAELGFDGPILEPAKIAHDRPAVRGRWRSRWTRAHSR